MINEKRPLLVAVVSIVLFISLSIVFKGRGQTELEQPSTGVLNQTQSDQSAKQLDDAATPIVDLANPDTADRIDKNARN
jgi:cell division protein FtsL